MDEQSLKYLAPNAEGLHFDRGTSGGNTGTIGPDGVSSKSLNIQSINNWEERSYFYSPYIFHPGLSNVLI